jgi:hypothetical protein
LCIHFGEGNRNIEYPRIRDNRIFNLSYHFYIKNVRLRITLQGATLGIYHLSPWQYINGNDTGRWNVRTPPFLSGSDCSFEFQENDKLFGKCFNKKLGFLTQCESSYSVRCATALYNGEDSFYIEKVIINGVTYWVDDVKKRGALMQELDSLLVQIKNLFFNNLRSGSNSNGFNDFAYAEVQYAE